MGDVATVNKTMSSEDHTAETTSDKTTANGTVPIKQQQESTTNIVIAALGGEGGGTLASWIEGVAHSCGWHAQTT